MQVYCALILVKTQSERDPIARLPNHQRPHEALLSRIPLLDCSPLGHLHANVAHVVRGGLRGELALSVFGGHG